MRSSHCCRGAKLEALRIEPEEAGEGAVASCLGLRQDLGGSRGSPYNHNWMHGRRHGRQVEVRIGCSEEYFKGCHSALRSTCARCWVRVAAPDFELVGERGQLRLSDSSPAAASDTVARITIAPVWHELRMAAGSEGIVANRPVRMNLPDHAQNGFVATYDWEIRASRGRVAGAAAEEWKVHLVSPRCAALSQSLSPLGRRALAAFIDGRLPAGQLQDELLRASNLESPTPGASLAELPARATTGPE